jgi:hypothetical protein
MSRTVDIYCSPGFGGTNHVLSSHSSRTYCGLSPSIEELLEFVLTRRPITEVTCLECQTALAAQILRFSP